MKNLWNEFKEFAFTGNVIDMAVGVILGGALKDVVTALVNMFMGVVSAIIKIPASLDKATAQVGPVHIAYGAFVSSFINFLLLALCVFVIVKALNTAKSRFKNEEAAEEVAPAKSDEVVLLEEIRDLLKKNA